MTRKHVRGLNVLAKREWQSLTLGSESARWPSGCAFCETLSPSCHGAITVIVSRCMVTRRASSAPDGTWGTPGSELLPWRGSEPPPRRRRGTWRSAALRPSRPSRSFGSRSVIWASPRATT